VLLVALFSLALFAPKRELYYLLEEQLMKQDIIINNEIVEDGLLSITLNHPEIYFKGIRIAEVESIRLWSLLFYSRLDIKSIAVNQRLQQFVATDIESIAITHTPLVPKELSLLGEGGFGVVDGTMGLESRVVRINIYDDALISKLKALLKQDDKGWYYETSF